MLTEFSNQLADVVAAAAPSIVQVQGGGRPASGVVYALDVVVTTMGAVGRENGLNVRRNDGQEVDAELVGWDPATSLAVLRAPSLAAPALAPSNAPVRVGHLALAIARSWSNAVTASAGIVAVIGGPLRTGRRRAIDEIFRTSAPMHEGFAGGAFLDATGGLIGVTTSSSIRGYRVIIPASIAWKAASIVLEHGRLKRGYLGIAGQPVSLPPHQRDAAGREHGLVVVGVVADGPAAQAGMLVGDIVLTLDGTDVESPERLMDLLMRIEAGRIVNVQVVRGSTLIDVAITARERPAR